MKWIAVAFMAAASAAAASAQEPAEVLAGDGGWIVRISTSGGFTGAGAGSFVVTSTGSVRCDAPARCASTLTAAQLQELSALVAAAAVAEWKTEPAGRCSDCYRINLHLDYRTEGSVRTYRAEWDEPLAGAQQAARIYRAVASLAINPQ